jgi:hypothetical protein
LWTYNNIHGIPFKNFDLADKDYAAIWNNIHEFLLGNMNTIDSMCIESHILRYSIDDKKELSTLLFAKGIALEVYSLNWLANKVGGAL